MVFSVGKNRKWRTFGKPTWPLILMDDNLIREALVWAHYFIWQIVIGHLPHARIVLRVRNTAGSNRPIGWMAKQRHKGVGGMLQRYRAWAIPWTLGLTHNAVLPPWAPQWQAPGRQMALTAMPSWLGQFAAVKKLRAVAQPPGERWGQCLPRANKRGQSTFSLTLLSLPAPPASPFWVP